MGDVTKVRRLLLPGGTYVAKTFGYDAYGNQTSATDETNRTTTTAFDGTDHLFAVSVQNPAGETATAAWDPVCGAQTQTTDPNSQSTSMQYDALCRLTRTDAPLGAFETRAYLNLGDPNAQHTRIESNPPTGASGNLWSEAYVDGFGRAYLTKKRGPSPTQSILTETTYNARGRVATTTSPFYEGNPQEVTEYEHDAQDRPTVLRHPDNTTATASYGLWEVTTTDENGKPSTGRFDAYGRAVESERSLNGQPLTTVSTFDLLGRGVGTTDPLGNSWSWTYDSLGRAVARHDPDSGSWAYAYDSAGRPTQQTDAKGQVTTFTYDPVGRPATKTSGVGTTTLTYGEPRPGFYNAGRLTTIASPGSVLGTDYDAAGREVKAKRTFGGVDYVLERRFDASGRPTGVTYPDGDSVGPAGTPYLYDEAGRLRAIPGIVTNVQYDASGRATVRANLNGTQTTWDYSSERGFLESLQTAGPATIQGLTYSRDPGGLIQQVTSGFPDESWSYVYDDLYRMTQATNLDTPNDTQSFAYDELGRMTYNSRVGNYTYPTAGQPRPHAPSSVDGSPYTYDANGNLIAGGGRAPVWDAENRISQVGTTQFTYDGFGERLEKTGPSGTSLYPVDEYEVTNGVITKYVNVASLGTVAKRVGSTTYWLHADHLGSIQAVTDFAGTIVHRRTYRPYGETIGQSGSHVESRGWIGERQDGRPGSRTCTHATTTRQQASS